MRYRYLTASVLVLGLTVSGTGVRVSGQFQAQAPADANPATADVRRLTEDEAVLLAVQNNLGIQVSRLNPQVEDFNVALARAAWQPALTSTLQKNRSNTPNTSFLSGAGLKTSDSQFTSNVSVQQPLPWGGKYSVGWDASRSTTNNPFSNFSPQLRSSLSLSFSQPLLRNFSIDSLRQQLRISRKNREIADIQVRQSVESTTRTVRRAYWDLAFAIASLQVQQQSLDLANASLRNTRARVDIGTTPPIDIVAAQAEVAQREEGVIVAQAQIETAQDALRALVYDPQMSGFWALRIEPAEGPAGRPIRVDVNDAVRNALERRTDLEQAKKTLEANQVNISYLHNQTLPDVTANFDYGLTGLGGTQFIRTGGFPGTIVGQTARGFGSVLSDLFGNQFPTWTASVDIRYPIGSSPQEASLARARLQYQQSVTQLRNQELQVVTQVRQAARQVQTNEKRMNTTRVARELSEQNLQAEQRKFEAGTSTNFLVFQAQRDLAQARNDELRAKIDYQQSVVDFQTVQEVPQ